MKKSLSIFFLLFTLLATACAANPFAPTVSVTPTPTPAAAQAAPSADVSFDAARAFEHNRKLSVDIGKRVAGTPGGASAADYIASEFQKSGLQVTREPFPFQAWEDKGTTVALTAPQTTQLEAGALQYSVGGKVDADVVLVPGLGNRDDFSKVNVRGKIALVKRGSIPFSDKAKNAAEVGAAALLIYNDTAPIFSGTLREVPTIPTIGLSGAAGAEILKQLSAGTVHAHIESNSITEQRTGYNIIGTLQGKSPETIVMGGHYDTVPAGPGAVDNGSGTATLLELARVMGTRPQPEHTLVFIAFDAEELGLLGSQAYVNQLTSDQLTKTRAMLNFDMLGGGKGPLLLMGDGNAALLARSSAQELGVTAQNGTLPANAGSDHQSFARKGVDTVFFMRDYNLLHTPQDSVDQVQQQFLQEAGRVGERLIERLDATPLKGTTSQN